MNEEAELSARLSGIVDEATTRVATACARHLRARLNPIAMDELRQSIELAVRAAALEGARNVHETSYALTEGRLTKPGYPNKVTRLAKAAAKLPNGI